MSTRPRTNRPATVNAAYWLWLVAAVASIVLCMLALTLPSDSIRESFTSSGSTDADVDSFLTVFRGFGVIFGVVGIGVGLMSGPVRAGDRRWRRALVALSAVAALLFVVGALVFSVAPLAVSLLLIVASVLAYRPSSREWFADA